MSIAVKTAAGWQVLGGEGGGSAWGDFTTNGDEQDSGTYGPDAQGRMWKWAEWNDPAKTPTVTMTGGLYWLLAVGGGSRSYSDASGFSEGQPGLVTEGLWEFQQGAPTVTVGKKGIQRAVGQADNYGQPSSVGNYGTQGFVPWGATAMGRGATTFNDSTGYKSGITGAEKEYATGKNGADVPGRAGDHTNPLNRDGCVIIATVTNDASDWNPPGALPGLGTWATITSVWDGSGAKPNRYAYNDGPGGSGGFNWVAFEWTDTTDPSPNSLTTQAGGLVDALVVGGGSYRAAAARFTSGRVNKGLLLASASHTIQIGTGQTVENNAVSVGDGSKIVGVLEQGDVAFPTLSVPGSLFLEAGNGPNGGVLSSITGTEIEYAAHDIGTPGGCSSTNGSPGLDGVVIVRVPAAQAAGVNSNEYVDVP